VLAGNAFGKIRAMFDFRGHKIKSAGPSSPVQVLGLGDVPAAGEVFQVVTNEREARSIIEANHAKQAEINNNAPKATLEQLFEKFQAGEVKELPLIIKADVQGSLEPIVNSLNDLSKGDIKINILQAEPGNITENDIMLATASKAIVIGFNVQVENSARSLADSEGISIRLYDIIYRMTEDIEKALKGMLEPEVKEVHIGTATVKAIFKINKVGTIAGCRVTEGELRRNGKIRVLRNGSKVFEGEVSSLKHEKDDVKEVRQGFECGISLKGYNDMLEGDTLECFTLEKNIK